MGEPHPGSVAPADVRFATPRLWVLHRYRPADLDAYAAANSDPEVMAHLSGVLDRAGSDAFAHYGEAVAEREGLGLLPVVTRAEGRFLGMCGLHRHRWYPDDVEIGWRFARHAWGHGYATEAARGWLAEAFGPLGLPRVISITAPGNARSLAVMARLGMRELVREQQRDAEGAALKVVVHVLDAADHRAEGAAGRVAVESS